MAHNVTVSQTNPHNPTEPKSFQIAGSFKICAIRFLDFFLTGIIPFVLLLILKNQINTHKWSEWIILGGALLWNILYFLVIPYYNNGQTFGKWIANLKLINPSGPILFRHLVARECCIIFIPWGIEVIINLVLYFGFNTSVNQLFTTNNSHKTARLAYRVVLVMLCVWYILLIGDVASDRKHQFFMDRKLNIFVVNKFPIIKKPLPAITEPMDRQDEHIHLRKDQPGNISDEALDAIDKLND